MSFQIHDVLSFTIFERGMKSQTAVLTFIFCMFSSMHQGNPSSPLYSNLASRWGPIGIPTVPKDWRVQREAWPRGSLLNSSTFPWSYYGPYPPLSLPPTLMHQYPIMSIPHPGADARGGFPHGAYSSTPEKTTFMGPFPFGPYGVTTPVNAARLGPYMAQGEFVPFFSQCSHPCGLIVASRTLVVSQVFSRWCTVQSTHSACPYHLMVCPTPSPAYTCRMVVCLLGMRRCIRPIYVTYSDSTLVIHQQRSIILLARCRPLV